MEIILYLSCCYVKIWSHSTGLIKIMMMRFVPRGRISFLIMGFQPIPGNSWYRWIKKNKGEDRISENVKGTLTLDHDLHNCYFFFFLVMIVTRNSFQYAFWILNCCTTCFLFLRNYYLFFDVFDVLPINLVSCYNLN